MKQIRISGLVRLAKAVRQELAGPISAERLAQLQGNVEENVKIVEQILREEHVRLDSLPSPSRKAYQFLKTVDFSRAATQDAASTNGYRADSVSFPGLRSHLNALLDRLARENDPSRLTQTYDAIRSSSENIEKEISAKDIRPEQIKGQSRDARGWLAYFSQRENFDGYIAAIRRARPIFHAASPWAAQPSASILVYFRPMRGVYRTRHGRNSLLAQLPTPMICFDADLLRSLSEMVLRKGHHRQTILNAMCDEPYRRILAELDLLSGVVTQTRGLHHDLAASFDRVNAAYFGGGMDRPRLVWSRTFTSRKFGHYDHTRDTVMVSLSLDRKTVATHVVDFIVYHELLHKKLGVAWKSNRMAAHTPQFAAMERQFRQYDGAKAVLNALARES